MRITISVSVDEKAKQEAQAIAKSAGLTLSTLINAYLLQVATTRQIDLHVPSTLAHDRKANSPGGFYRTYDMYLDSPTKFITEGLAFTETKNAHN